jgi:hypothetical protein
LICCPALFVERLAIANYSNGPWSDAPLRDPLFLFRRNRGRGLPAIVSRVSV